MNEAREQNSDVAVKRRLDGRSFRYWLVGAAFIHSVAGFAIARRLPSKPHAVVRAPRRMELSLIEEAPTPESPLDDAAAPSALAGPSQVRGRHRGSQAPHARAQTPAIDGSRAGSESAPQTANEAANLDAASGDAPPSPRLSADQLGIGAANPFLGANPKSERVASAEQRLGGSMRQMLLDADRGHGLARGGAVLEALRAATIAAVPGNGTAEFLATTDSGGAIVNLEPTTVSSEFHRWEAVARRTLAALARKRLRVPSGSAGLTIRFKVIARLALPSGRDPGFGTSVLGIPITKGDGPHPTRVDFLTPMVMAGPVHAGGSDDLPALTAGIGIFKLDGDPVDIGAKAQRTVSATITDERAL